ncbi:hypothetical protein ACOSQ3_031801 [Xanthoceras sorbifolium]
MVAGLFDNNGSWHEDEVDVNNIIIDYFSNIFMSRPPSHEQVEAIIHCVTPRVTPSMNRVLDAPFTPADVKTALFQMYPTKAPGIDGLPTLFYQQYWNHVGDLVTAACLRCLNEGHSVEAFNYTLIVLIPKVQNPIRVTDFRPINLCNVIYKIVAKVLTNRFRGVLGGAISNTQSAFLSGRLITDNAVIGFECIHSIKRQSKGRVGRLALKLDMSKAYDRVEWDFLRKMMLKIGFSSSWTEKIMNCVTTVSYSILRNGVPMGKIIPSRGLR